MSKSHKDRTKLWAEELAEEYFNSFLDPCNRGPNFTWEKFPTIAQRMAEVQRPLSLFPLAKNKEELNEIAGKTAFRTAQSLVEKNSLTTA